MSKLSTEEITGRLDTLSNWSELNGSIQRTFQFKDFMQAMEFVERVADAAEERQHHPDILIRYNKVTLTLSTHDAGGITEKDFEFAGVADALA